jgi:hypothetical protein
MSMSAQLEGLVGELEDALESKLASATVDTRFTTVTEALDALDSQTRRLQIRLALLEADHAGDRRVEGPSDLYVQIEQNLRTKIGNSTATSRYQENNILLDGQESMVALLSSRLRLLEDNLGIIFSQSS